jgi:glucokinase
VKRILAADIGGTNCRFGAFAVSGGSLEFEGSTWIRTADACSFDELLGLLAGTDFPLAGADADMAVFAVAGPVQGGVRSSMPNIPWDIDLEAPGQSAGRGRSMLINDFAAQAFATRTPAGDSAREVLPGTAAPDGVVAAVGAGTGLGHAALVADGAGGYRVVPSERGHAAFPFVSDREEAYGRFLRAHLGEPYTRGDTVVSGRGTAFLHEFLTGERLSPEEVTAGFEKKAETLAWFARFYARACRDYALTVVAAGGVFIAGGIAARTPAVVEHPEFRREFLLSPVMGELLATIPVRLMTDQESGLWGAARFGLQELGAAT